MFVLPSRRAKQLVVVDLPGETLVYDLKRHRAYHLNRTTALVWRHCDGSTTSAQMAAILARELKVPDDEVVVSYALDQLGRVRLLEKPLRLPVGQKLSRRDLIRKLALVGAAVLVPTVLSILAPSAAQAATCIATNGCTPATIGQACGPPGCTKICCANLQCKAVC